MESSRPFGSIEYAASFLRYFEQFSQSESMFLPELDVATQVVRLMRQGSDAVEVRSQIGTLMRSLDARPHYDGSAWHAFRAAVNAWLEKTSG